MRIPIPDGWKVARGKAASDCPSSGQKTILVLTDDKACGTAPIEVHVGPRWVWPSGSVVAFAEEYDGESDLITTPQLFTLPGGEPAWLRDSLESEWMRPDRQDFSYTNDLTLPWSMTTITVRFDGPTAVKFFGTIRTDPVGDGALALPAKARIAELTTPDASGVNRPDGHATMKDPKKIDALLGLLNRQNDTVAGAQACSGPGQPAARLELTDYRDQDSSLTTTVIIAIGKDCREAVSSRGGRVWLDDATFRELKKSFGIGER